MNSWMMWLVLAGIVVILELFTGTFYLLMIAIGLLAGALTALLSPESAWSMIVAAIVGATATVALHKSKYGWNHSKREVACDPNVNMDIGQSIHIQDWQDQGNGKFSARAMYRGAMWDVDLRGATAHAGLFVIEEMQGSRLIVRPA
ncbi:MAG: NfeD family protein [Burkholderiales bacterium]|nr:NfeD family protein [Burkholderiales bacterium]